MDDWQIKVIQMDAKLDSVLEKVSSMEVKVDNLNNFKLKITGAASVIVIFFVALWDIIKIKLEKMF